MQNNYSNSTTPFLSIIIPTLNESQSLRSLLPWLRKATNPHTEIWVVDGGSTDDTIAYAQSQGVNVLQTRPGRAHQMNRGAREARGETLYFLHADTRPPITLLDDLRAALQQAPAGCYRLGFKVADAHPLLQINAFFTRFPMLWCRGGDQSLYVRKDVFEDLGGFPQDWLIMEEYHFIERVREEYDFHIIPKRIIASSRKYDLNNYWRVQYAHWLIFRRYRQGAGQQELFNTYRRLLQLPR